MPNQIRMTPDQMRSRATQYTKEAGNLQAIIDSMNKLLQALQTEWEGNTATKFAARYKELEPSFKAAKELIDEIATTLNKYANSTEEHDNNWANSI